MLDLPNRPRRLRRTPAIRSMVAETRVNIEDLIYPLFVIEGDGEPEAVESMPGVFRRGIKDLVIECKEALNPDTLVLRAVRAIKEAVPGLVVITDVALDPYTTHGHDGILSEDGSEVLNDETVEILAKMAVLQAEAGVDFVAPSDMMDGRIGEIRELLDDEGFTNTGILAYSAKFASAYYGPFRDAVGSASAAGTHHLDKRTYQLDPGNRREALREIELDEAEGADILMVKPAGPYLDIIRDVRDNTDLPVAAYQVSGEYAQIHAAAQKGWLDLAKCRDESLLAIKRAGADMILTYFAKEVAQLAKA
jgi:porphobilinogen synthase